jgi:hypothetical protein
MILAILCQLSFVLYFYLKKIALTILLSININIFHSVKTMVATLREDREHAYKRVVHSS